MEFFGIIVYSFQPLTILAKSSNLDSCGGPEYASDKKHTRAYTIKPYDEVIKSFTCLYQVNFEYSLCSMVFAIELGDIVFWQWSCIKGKFTSIGLNLFTITSKFISLFCFWNKKRVQIFQCSPESVSFTKKLRLHSRCSHRSYSLKEAVLRNFVKFTRKHLCWSHIFIKNFKHVGIRG